MIFDRWREKRNQKIEEKLEDQRKQAEEQARSSVENYTSRRAILRKSLPMIFLGGVLAAVELLIIGALYTLVSLLIYMPLLYFYTKSMSSKSSSGTRYLFIFMWPPLCDTSPRYFPPYRPHRFCIKVKQWHVDKQGYQRIESPDN